MDKSVVVTRTISASPSVVWGMISDVTRMGEWSPETVSCRWVKGATGPAVGAKFAGDNRNGSKKWSTTCTVTACQPDKVFEFKVDVGPLKVSTWRYDLAASGTDCVVTETWTDRRGKLISALGKPFSGVSDRATHNRAGMEHTLQQLAAAAEQSAS
jgi:uncharacterized protein YndB with AHSA1/START domain